jgi:hypothetical protein
LEATDIEGPNMTWQTVKSLMFPKQNVGTVSHMFVPKRPWADRVEHGAAALVIGYLVIDADWSSIPVSFEGLILWVP